MCERRLSWSVVVVTYDREEVLLQMLPLVVKQTCPPREIIIIDASDDYAVTKEKVLARIKPLGTNIKWIFEKARIKSCAEQRNQGIALSTADIVFFLDDDSFIYPDYADEILKVYEADSDQLISGVEGLLVDQPPTTSARIQIEEENRITDKPFIKRLNRKSRIIPFLRQHVFLEGFLGHFIPYDNRFYLFDVTQVGIANIVPTHYLIGCAMTYRQEVLAKERFESALRYYALTEDCDLAYRVSRHGGLVKCLTAKVCHIPSAAGRLTKPQVDALSILNMTFLLIKYTNDITRDKRKLRTYLHRKLVAHVLKDLARRNLTLPRSRAVFSCRKHIRKMLTLTQEALDVDYVEIQKSIADDA